MDTDTIERRTRAITGRLVGDRVRFRVPHRGGVFAEVGTVRAVSLPLVAIDVGGGRRRYRHINDLQLINHTQTDGQH
jgi:hypothetical protein